MYENAVAQELYAHGFEVYYFNNKKQGELDFVIEYEGSALPIEVKSGKSYTKHHALDHVLQNPNYHIEQAIVLCNENIEVRDKICYYPIYMAGFLKKRSVPEDYIYTLDLSALQD